MKVKLIILTILVVILTAFTFMRIELGKVKKVNEYILNDNDNKKRNYSNLYNKYLFELKLNNYSIDSLADVINLNNDTIPLVQVLSTKPTLVFFFSKLACPPCINHELTNLKSKETIFGVNNTLIITDFDNHRDIVMFCKINEIKYAMYILNNKDINSLLFSKPYLSYFILSKEMKMREVFLVDKDSPELTSSYLETVSYKYFK